MMQSAALNSGARVVARHAVRRPSARATAVKVEATSSTIGKEGAVRVRMAAVAAAAVLFMSSPHSAIAAVDAGCAKSCVAECLKLAPGSKDYCVINCDTACDKDIQDQAGDDEGAEELEARKARTESAKLQETADSVLRPLSGFFTR